MTRFLIAFGGAFVAFLALDAVWLSVMGGALYRAELGGLLLDGFRPAPAILFYLIYLAGLVRFAVRPNETRSLRAVAIDAAWFGFTAYATYDLTNQATLKTWSTTVTVADLLWGTFVSTAGATAGRWALRFAETR